jgi:hypothetical protein
MLLLPPLPSSLSLLHLIHLLQALKNVLCSAAHPNVVCAAKDEHLQAAR